MLTNDQKSLLKRAQRQAGISEEEYRDTLERYAGVRSSTDPAVTDEHLDLLLAYFEAIYWRAVDAKTLPAPCKRGEPFVQRGYWAAKNPTGNTSRDRYTTEGINDDIATLERQLTREFGCGYRYFEAIKGKVIPAASSQMTWPAGLMKYKVALERTLAAKRKKASQPF